MVKNQSSKQARSDFASLTSWRDKLCWSGSVEHLKRKNHQFLTNRLGYGNGDRIWYLTLFDWETPYQ